MLTLANQQEIKTGWFVGILEGEGNFRNTLKSNIEVRIVNTDLQIIFACEDYLDKNYICYVRTERDRRIGWKILYCISIRNSCEQTSNWPQLLYNLIEPSLECRRDQYQQILSSPTSIRTLSVDFDWMIGIYEAEGTFSIILDNRGYAALNINLANTNQKILTKVEINLKAIGLTYYVQSFSKKEEEWHKDKKSIRIVGMKRCRRFLLATKDKWISSRNQKRSSLMLEFIESRLTMNMYESYSDRQYQIIQTLGDLNR